MGLWDSREHLKDTGTGMKGGRSTDNIFDGSPTVKVAGALNNNNGWATTTVLAVPATAGYDNVSNYTEASGVNLYANRTIEHLLGQP